MRSSSGLKKRTKGGNPTVRSVTIHILHPIMLVSRILVSAIQHFIETRAIGVAASMVAAAYINLEVRMLLEKSKTAE